MKRFVLPAILLLTSIAFAQSDPTAQAARRWRQQHERAIVDELVALAALPNITGQQESLLRNVEFIRAMLKKRGMAPKIVSVSGGAPVVVGEVLAPGATRTIVI
jgi:hypothetical protein